MKKNPNHRPIFFLKNNRAVINYVLICLFLASGCVSPGPQIEYPSSSPITIGGIKADGYQVVPLLLYHDFRKKPKGLLQMSSEELKKQMAYIKENGYQVISLERFFNFINLKQGLPEKAVVITIDDGWKSTYTILYPILKKFGFCATLFVYTDFISPNNPSALTWEMIKEMSNNGIDIQAHSKTHQFGIPWKKENETDEDYQKRIEQELLIPKNIIEKHTGKKVKYIAYPYGHFNEALIRAAKKYGYEGGLTVAGSMLREGVKVRQTANAVFIDPFEVRRIHILAGRGLKKFAYKLRTFKKKVIYDGRYDHMLRSP